MRVWDIEPGRLCCNHLLGEHREIHAIWVVLTQNKKGYSRHPEVLRWKGKLKALYLRHDRLVKEMVSRGYRHNSDLSKAQALGSPAQKEYVDLPYKQLDILKNKKCGCKTD
jgi:hypothetical protein